MRRSAAGTLITVLAMTWTSSAHAIAYIRVSDMSQVQYQTSPDGKVYFRNLNAFNSSALGCCYNYYIDTTTVEGKNVWAMFLSYIATQRGLWLGVPDGYAAGVVSWSGDW
jgi:hypothetical protein